MLLGGLDCYILWFAAARKVDVLVSEIHVEGPGLVVLLKEPDRFVCEDVSIIGAIQGKVRRASIPRGAVGKIDVWALIVALSWDPMIPVIRQTRRVIALVKYAD
jgi:hypothetical protein